MVGNLHLDGEKDLCAFRGNGILAKRIFYTHCSFRFFDDELHRLGCFSKNLIKVILLFFSGNKNGDEEKSFKKLREYQLQFFISWNFSNGLPSYLKNPMFQGKYQKTLQTTNHFNYLAKSNFLTKQPNYPKKSISFKKNVSCSGTKHPKLG